MHYNYGRAPAAKGLLERVQAEFEAALRLDPDFSEAATSLGILMAMKGQVDSAIGLYRRAIQIKPRFTFARLQLGLALLQRGERQEAKQLFRSVVQSDPNGHQAQLELGKSEGRYDEAALCLQMAAESSQPDIRAAAQKLLSDTKENLSRPN